MDGIESSRPIVRVSCSRKSVSASAAVSHMLMYIGGLFSNFRVARPKTFKTAISPPLKTSRHLSRVWDPGRTRAQLYFWNSGVFLKTSSRAFSHLFSQGFFWREHSKLLQLNSNSPCECWRTGRSCGPKGACRRLWNS